MVFPLLWWVTIISRLLFISAANATALVLRPWIIGPSYLNRGDNNSSHLWSNDNIIFNYGATNLTKYHTRRFSSVVFGYSAWPATQQSKDRSYSESNLRWLSTFLRW
jgi:hypothetical protein